MMCCASCGTAEIDDVKLKPCDGCDLVSYCGDACQQLHRPEHAGKCRKRAAELRDEILFRQPESTHLGDCPICCLPFPIKEEYKNRLYPCCGKSICAGCSHADNLRHDREEIRLACPFCRQNLPTTQEETDTCSMKRVAANDPDAIRKMGSTHYDREEYDAALEYWTKAAELGDVDAHYNLSLLYQIGHGVEKDETKRVYHLEEAAIAGHPHARFNLGTHEWNNNNNAERAVKHFIIAASLGIDESINVLKECFKKELVSKEDFAAALRAHHAAVAETKSPQRETAKYFDKFLGV